jgi:type III pantothenate kinase
MAADEVLVCSEAPLIAVDVGNSRIKLGLFRQTVAAGLPEPQATLHLTGRLPEFEQLDAWLDDLARSGKTPVENALRGVPDRSNTSTSRNATEGVPYSQTAASGNAALLRWHIGSVNRPAASRLIDWLRDHRPDDEIMLLTSGDLPLVVKLPRPDMVGVDRLLDALAANRLRTPGRPAVVVDVGSAITVDLVDAEGAFLGGAILPGIAMSARALHEFTDLLPRIDMAELAEPPPALGNATVAAMRAGLFWGAVGSVRQLVEQLTGGRHVPMVGDAEVFLTGGAGPIVAQLMGRSARYVPHLTLAGIALADKA